MGIEENGHTADEALASAEAEAAAARARAEAARARAAELRHQAATAADPTPAGEEGPTAPASTVAAPPQARRPSRLPTWRHLRPAAAAVAALLICGLLAASGYLVHQHRVTDQNRQRAAEFTAAARQGVVNMMAINFKTAETDVQRVLENSTGTFKEQFQDTAQDLVKAIKDAKVTTDVAVNGTAVESMTPDSAVVLVAATSERGEVGAQNRDPRTWRAIVTVTRENGQLKVSQLDYV